MQIKKALIVHNKPLYELHIIEEKDPYYLKLYRGKHPTTRIWKKVYEEHRNTLEGVERTLKLLGIQTDILFRKKVKGLKNYDLIVTVGGDGTFLETSHLVQKNQILLGVNAAPFDSTGALCRGRLDNFLTTLVGLIEGTIKPKLVPRLKVKLGKKILPYPVLNEVLFANQSSAGTSRYLIEKGKLKEEHKSSGVWMSTSTGSTAAIRSAGGTPMPLGKPGMQFAVRELFPEKDKKFKVIRGILPAKSKLVFYSKMRQGALFIDGSHLMFPVGYGEKVEVSPDGPPLLAIL